MSDFAVPEETCRAAFDQLAGRLPPGFVGEDWYNAWLAVMREGGAFDWRTRQRLADLLPGADRWPALTPVCSPDIDETPADLLSRTAVGLAFDLARADRDQQVAEVFPWRRFVAVLDQRTCPDHLALHGVIRRHDDPFWAGVDASFWWGCRCTSSTMNARTAERRGFVVPI